MKTIFKSILAVLPLALVAPITANAAQDWKHNCAGPQYVCGGEASVAKAKSAKTSSVKVKAKQIIKLMAKFVVDHASDAVASDRVVFGIHIPQERGLKFVQRRSPLLIDGDSRHVAICP